MRSNIPGIAPEWYTLGIDKDEADPVQFYIKPLDGFGWMHVMSKSYNPETGIIGSDGIEAAFRKAVKNWRNIEDAENPGEMLDFSAQVMGTLPVGWIMEVGNRVLSISKVKAGESKNSASPSSSQKT